MTRARILQFPVSAAARNRPAGEGLVRVSPAPYPRVLTQREVLHRRRMFEALAERQRRRGEALGE